MKLLGSNGSKITKGTNGQNLCNLKITKVILVHCNIVNNGYQQGSRVFCTFIPSKLLGQLLDISSKNLIFSKTFNSAFSYIELWFPELSSKPLKAEDKINITLVIRWSVKYTL